MGAHRIEKRVYLRFYGSIYTDRLSSLCNRF